MDPNDIWALPPLSTSVEKSEDSLYTSVGRALSRWEVVEGLLSEVFSMLVSPTGALKAAKRAYGGTVAFAARKDMLENAAEAYFEDHPDEALQASLANVMKVMARASPRRNDIAHGVVQPIWITDRMSDNGFLLVPSYYTSRRRSLAGHPTYRFGTTEIDRFGAQFTAIGDSTVPILTDIWAKHGPKRQSLRAQAKAPS